jgi:hypothetical protein
VFMCISRILSLIENNAFGFLHHHSVFHNDAEELEVVSLESLSRSECIF